MASVEPKNLVEASKRVFQLAGQGNTSMGVPTAILTLFRTEGSFTAAEDWLRRRGFPTEDTDNARIDWWDKNIEKYFEHNPNGQSGLRLKTDACS